MLSIVILAKNEEQNIEKCINSIKDLGEILVVDDESEDKTREVAAKLGARVIPHKSNSDFSQQRNFGMNEAQGEWILFLDADEILTDELKKEIQHISTNASTKNGHRLKRRDFFWGKELKYGEVSDAYNKGIIRLIQKDSGEWVGKIHEEFKFKNGEHQASSLNGFIDHYPHQTVKEFLNHVNLYSSIRAMELADQGRRTNWFEIIAFPIGKFINSFFLWGGFRDGIHGCVYSFMMAFHSFLVRSKLYLKSH